MSKEKRAGWIIIIAFIVLICIPNIVWIVFRHLGKVNNYENRELESKPVFELETAEEYPRLYEKYYNDNIPFRNILVTINNGLDYFIFNKSSNDDVVKGKDGWLYFAETTSNYEDISEYDDEKMQTLGEAIKRIDSYMSDRNIEFVIFVGPNKNTIYREYVPSKYARDKEKFRTDQMVEYLQKNTDVKVIFPKEELLDAKKNNPKELLYFKNDSHWNYLGGYIGVQPLLELLGHKREDYKQLSYSCVNEPLYLWNGYDLSNLLGLSKVLNKDENYYFPDCYDESVKYEGDARRSMDDFYGVVRSYSDASDPRKVFLMRDSYGEAIAPFIAGEFAQMYSVHKNSFTLSQIEEEQPDIFIYEMVERNAWELINLDYWQP